MQVNEIVVKSKKVLKEEKRISDINSTLRSNLIEGFKVLLKEALDIRQVQGGFEVFDNSTGQRTPGTVIYPSEGDAEEARDRVRARVGGSTRPSNSNNRRTPPSLAPVDVPPENTNRRSLNARIASRAFKARHGNPLNPFNAFRRGWMYPLAAALGLTVEWQELGFGDEVLESWYKAAEAGRLLRFPEGINSLDDFSPEELNAHMLANEAKYEDMVGYAYGVLCAAYYASIFTALLGPVKTIVKTGKSGLQTSYKIVTSPIKSAIQGKQVLRKFFRHLRTMRNASAVVAAAVGAAAGAGVGGIVTGLVSLILGTTAIWIVELAITRSGLGESILEYIANWTLKQDMEGGLAVMGVNIDPGLVLEWIGTKADGNLTSVAANVSDQQLRQNLQDVRRNVLKNPQTTATDRRIVQNFDFGDDSNTSPQAAAGGSGTAGGATGGSGTARGTTGGAPARNGSTTGTPTINPNLFPQLN
jgi:hypothetical protein